MTEVELSTDGPVWTVTINRPEKRNAVNPDTALQLRAAFDAFEADPAAAVAVLTGAGGTFCAGFDLAVAASGEGERYDPVGEGPMGPTRRLLSKPVIAAVEGHAVAGGLELALWCDLRVASESAIFGVFCRRWGVPLIDGGTVRLPRLVGQGRALDMILTGRAVARRRGAELGPGRPGRRRRARRWPPRKAWPPRSPPSRRSACAPTAPRPSPSGTSRWRRP
jgi:enoyl-CoA hydratase